MTFSSSALIYVRNNYQVFLSVFFSGKFLEKIARFLIYHKIRKENPLVSFL